MSHTHIIDIELMKIIAIKTSITKNKDSAIPQLTYLGLLYGYETLNLNTSDVKTL